MIEKMRRYTFLIHHSEYLEFLTQLQKLGMVHIVRNTRDKSGKLLQTQEEMEAYSSALAFMKKWLSDKETVKQTALLPLQMRQQIDKAHLEKERLTVQYNVLSKELSELEPWGEFDYALFNDLEKHGLKLDLYSCTLHHFKLEWAERYTLREINRVGHLIYFAVLHKADEPVEIDAENYKLPPKSLTELRVQLASVSSALKDIETFYLQNAPAAVELFTNELEKLAHAYEFEDAIVQSMPEAENQVKVLRGWIPKRLESELISFVNERNLLHFAEDGKVEDNPPILLKNNWFARTFEPIGNMFMLPYYNELDLTPFFAPFYLMFFGFCAGDSGYGIVMIILGWLLKKKMKNEGSRRFLTLIQFLGVGTIIMGFVMGSFFAFDLKKIGFLNPYIPIRDTNQIFNFALLLGVIQIVTGKILNAIKQMIQSGFVHGIATLGMVLFVLSLAISGSTMLGAKPGKILDYTSYGMYAGLALILLLNSPGKNIFLNIANGLWIMYGAITGFFGDLLSYIRLFALGVSGGILGLVINDMARQFGGIPVVGPVVFVLFMIAGHGLNIALSGLGAFVHPMRLTFVEFFNNAGFSGPGIAYKPFGQQNQVNK